MSKIQHVVGREILDSRGNPTIEVAVTLESGAIGIAMIPSGASTGVHEAVELRDNDPKRYGGKGVLTAVTHVNTVLREAVTGLEAVDQKGLDSTMITLDGTENKGRLGANAILGISLATARAYAIEQGVPLYTYINTLLGTGKKVSIPVPMFNVLNGGMHSDSGISVQEFMLMPHGISTYREQLRAGSEIFHALKKLLGADGLVTSVGDEGGFAPRVKSHNEAFTYILKAIEAAGYIVGKEVSIALDAASSSFYTEGEGTYHIAPEGDNLNSESLIALYASWVEQYHLVSIEDGLSEDDWGGWASLKAQLESKKHFTFVSHPEKLESKFMLVGDDLLVTNPKRLQKAIDEKSCNAVLIKVNQIGTLTETLDCIRLAQAHDMRVVVSHRSGETTDDFIADLASGSGAECIKTGSLSRGERLAKYNRLLAIEAEIA